jgi:hypothetical protein
VTWAFSCDFYNNDFKNVQITGEKCGGICAQTSGCTHFTYNGYSRTCWMKSGIIATQHAFKINDNNYQIVCGIVGLP